jgi:tRNA(fMet)-specific endonuclease VapC
MYVYDTNIVLALIRDGPLGQYLAASYPIDPGDPPKLSVVSLGEIRSLAARLGWGAGKVQRMHDLLIRLAVVQLGTAAVLDAYVEIDLACQAHPGGARALSKNDLWIAATARALGIPLLTTDRDFDCLHPAWITRVWVDPASTLPPAAP